MTSSESRPGRAGEPADAETTAHADATLSLPMLEDASAEEALVGGRYRLEGTLGGGGMGVVYAARHLDLGRVFALKLIRPGRRSDPSFAERFRTEAAALGRLKHPGIVDVTDFGVDQEGSRAYLVMEHLEGCTLDAERRARGRFTVEAALSVLDAIARALDFAHRSGVLHLDLKPSNVFLVAGSGPAPATKILDFGLARLIAPNSAAAAAETAELEGTPAYLAPERVTGRSPTAASDLYSFGTVAYELLTGRLPFEGTVAEILQGHLVGNPPPPSSANPELPSEADGPILSALAKDPLARPRTAVEVVDGLREALTRARQRAWRARERPRRVAMALTGGVLLAIAGLGLSGTDAARDLERRASDLLFALRGPQAPDPRLLLVVLDEGSLAGLDVPLAALGDEAGRLLAAVYDAGARAIAIDMLLPAQWGAAPAFSDLVLRHADSLTLAFAAAADGTTVGVECLDDLTRAALGPDRASALFGSVAVAVDRDGVSREARLLDMDAAGRRRPTWPGRAALTAGAQGRPEVVRIDATVDVARLPRISWRDLATELESRPQRFRDRLVLVGAEYTGSGDDAYRVTASSGSPALSGLELQALVVHTALSGRTIRKAPAWVVWATLGSALVFFLATLLYHHRLRVGLVVWLALVVGGVAAAVTAFSAGLLLPLATPLAVTVFALLLGLLARVRLSPFPVGGPP